jgi:Cu(I)/Ag(I) efflux system protein CusF
MEMNTRIDMKKLPARLVLTAALAIGGALAGSAMAQTTGEHSGHHPAANQPAATEFTDGEIRKVDKDGGTLTIKHGTIKNLDMPAMTMVFQVKVKSLLDRAKAGDKIRFRAESVNGKLLVTDIQTVK